MATLRVPDQDQSITVPVIGLAGHTLPAGGVDVVVHDPDGDAPVIRYGDEVLWPAGPAVRDADEAQPIDREG